RAQERADAGLVRQEPAEIEGGRRPWTIPEGADLDELSDAVAQQPGRDEHQCDPGPAEEGAEIQAVAAPVEAIADQDGECEADHGPDEDPDCLRSIGRRLA